MPQSIQNLTILTILKTQPSKMSKKLKIPSIFKNKEAKQPRQWPLCKHPKTLSFRACNDDVFVTLNSVFRDAEAHDESLIIQECAGFSTDDHVSEETESLEMVLSGVRTSERLFFEPAETSSIVKESKTGNKNSPFKDSVALTLESDDPYLDFKKSMQEMVESQGLLKDWDFLEELLGWYLRMNGKMNHGFIVGAFVDLLVGFAAVDSKRTMISCSGSTSYSSASSSFSSPSSPDLSPTVVVDNVI